MRASGSRVVGAMPFCTTASTSSTWCNSSPALSRVSSPGAPRPRRMVLPATPSPSRLPSPMARSARLLLSSLASWDYPNERVDIVGSNTSALSVENGRQLRVFRRVRGGRPSCTRDTLSVHWWSGHEEQGFIPQLRFFARQIRQGVRGRRRQPGRGNAGGDRLPGARGGGTALDQRRRPDRRRSRHGFSPSTTPDAALRA